MSGDLQSLKIDHMFRIYDVDRDGEITRADYERYVRRLAHLRGWTGDHPAHRRFCAQTAEHWGRMRAAGDADGDGRVSLDEYRAYIRGWIAGGAATVDQSADAWFAAFDDDEDGRVTAEEYAVVLRAYGLEGVDAGAHFRHFDADRDGFLTHDDVRALNRQFWFSERLADPGHYILGPVAGLPGVLAPAAAT